MDNKIDAFSMETLPTEAIVLPLYERPLFPGTFTTLMVGRPEDVSVITQVIEGSSFFVAALFVNDKPERIATLARVTKFIRLPNNCLHVFISTIERVAVSEYQQIDGVYHAKAFTSLPDTPVRAKSLLSYVRVLRDTVMSMSQTTNLFAFASEINVSNIDDPSILSFYVASSITAKPEFLQSLLNTTNPKTRIEMLLSHIALEKEIIDKENEVKQDIYDRIKTRNKEQILREQIKALNQELNQLTGRPAGKGKGGDASDLYARAENTRLPEVFRQAVDKELDKLSGLETMNPEYAMTKLYIETILSLPFSFEEGP